MSCPLCSEVRSRPSWLGATTYQGREFPYVECQRCASLYCDPMPDEATLTSMYGLEYDKSFDADPAIPDPKEPGRVIRWLTETPRGTFLDYGCGSGTLLTQAAKLGWQISGVEFDPKVAAQTSQATGARILTTAEATSVDEPIADVLHLGDVIEHLTQLDQQMPQILKLLKPGGLLLAQGPLEANANLFTALLRLGRQIRHSRYEMPPYHVLLATARGQRRFFERFGLTEREFRLSEVSWPAPARLGLSDLKRVRTVGLFAARRASQSLSMLRPRHLGNRYFYAGTW